MLYTGPRASRKRPHVQAKQTWPDVHRALSPSKHGSNWLQAHRGLWPFASKAFPKTSTNFRTSVLLLSKAPAPGWLPPPRLDAPALPSRLTVCSAHHSHSEPDCPSWEMQAGGPPPTAAPMCRAGPLQCPPQLSPSWVHDLLFLLCGAAPQL